MKKMLKCFRDFAPNHHQGSAKDLGEIANKKKCDNKIHVIFYFNYLMKLGAERNYRLRKFS